MSTEVLWFLKGVPVRSPTDNTSIQEREAVPGVHMEPELLVRISMVPDATPALQLSSAMFEHYILSVAAQASDLLDMAPRCLSSGLVTRMVGV